MSCSIINYAWVGGLSHSSLSSSSVCNKYEEEKKIRTVVEKMFVVLTSISFESPDNQNKFISVKQSERGGREGWVDELFRNIFQSSSTVLDIEKWRKKIDEQITSRFKQIYRTLTSPRVTQIANLVVVADDELEQELWYQSGGWRALSFALLASRRGGKSFEHYISSFSSFFTSFNLYAQRSSRVRDGEG